MNTTRIYTNCGPLCSEQNGGDCPGVDCPYRPTLTLVTNDEPFGESDWHLIEQAAELRGIRLGHRYARTQYRQGVKYGFWTGVVTVFVAMFVIAILQWVAR